MNDNNIIKAVRETVNFAPEYPEQKLWVDGYLLPDKTFRVGKTSIAAFLGFENNWTGRLLTKVTKNEGKDSKHLLSRGFSGVTKPVKIKTKNNIGEVIADTLSLEDFRKLIRLADKKGMPRAEAVVDALLDIPIEDYFRMSFGIERMTFEEVKAKFYTSYAGSLNWLEEDKADWKLIEEQERFLRLN